MGSSPTQATRSTQPPVFPKNQCKRFPQGSQPGPSLILENGRNSHIFLHSFQRLISNLLIQRALLADAADSKSVEGNFVGVQLPLPAPR